MFLCPSIIITPTHLAKRVHFIFYFIYGQKMLLDFYVLPAKYRQRALLLIQSHLTQCAHNFFVVCVFRLHLSCRTCW